MKIEIPEIKKILSAKDTIPKIICVLLSVMLWFYISGTNVGEVKFKIPIIFSNLSETFVKSKVSTRYITVTLKGKKDILKNVNVKSLKAVVDLEHPSIGVNRDYSINLIKDEIPENIEIGVSSRQVKINVERKIYKKVKIKTYFTEKAKDGYVLGNIRIVPDTVTINGPESIVNRIDFIQTNNISIGNKTGRIIKEVSLNKKNFSNIKLNVSHARVIIPIIEASNLYKFKKEIILKSADDHFKYILSHQEANIYLQADKEDIEPSEDDVDIFVNIASANLEQFFKNGNTEFIEKNYTLNVNLKREGVRVISILPDIVSVKVIRK